MNTNRGTQKGDISVMIARITAAVVGSILLWSTAVAGHETGATTGPHESTVPFVAVIGVSVGAGLLIGTLAVVRWQQDSNRYHRRLRWELPVVLLAVGFVALLAAATQNWHFAVGGGIVGGTVAWLGRGHSVSPHGGCADAALGAIVAHRTVEGAVVASIYAASAALGVVGVALLTVHAIAETAVVGGLYASVGRWWGAGTILAVQLAFIGGALAGGFLVGIFSIVTVPLLAAVGGVLVVTGATEFQTLVTHQQKQPHV